MAWTVIVSAAESLREFRQGELSIACLPVFSQSSLPLLLPPFLARYPEVSLQIVPQESPLLEEWLSAQRHDLGPDGDPAYPRQWAPNAPRC